MDDIFEPYRRFADFLGETLGEGHEIVLQDLREGACRVIYIAGDPVTNRKEGSPLTDLGLKLALGETWKNNDSVCNYTGYTSDGRILRCSTLFIKQDEDLVGMLCINIDSSPFVALSSKILKLGGIVPIDVQSADLPSEPDPAPHRTPESSPPPPHHRDGDDVAERFFGTQSEMIDSAVNRLYPSRVSQTPSSGDAGSFTMPERQAIVAELNAMGFFLMKGATQEAAEKLGCSVPTIYRYRSQAKQVNRRQPMPLMGKLTR